MRLGKKLTKKRELSDKKILRLIKKYKASLDEMAHYDNTFEKLWGRERIYLTLNKKTILKLRKIREQTGKPISRIVDEQFA